MPKMFDPSAEGKVDPFIKFLPLVKFIIMKNIFNSIYVDTYFSCYCSWFWLCLWWV